ncbi:MAG TPA: SDR family oxidoreductase [Verrucomicrobiae bacterium]|nr:SDR family oxidoreductase [Verrucomicrobiae bacterium]
MNGAIPETVLITGASSGIGRELARCFAGDGARLVLVARNTAALEELADELRRDYHVVATVLTADLSHPESPGNIFAELKGRGVVVDILVNNAGFGAHDLFLKLPLERQMDIIQVNLAALTELTGLFLPGMVARRRGGVLNVGSVAGFVPGPGMAVYYATKAFVLSFTEALAAELAGTGLTITVVCPGPTATNFGRVARFEFESQTTRVPVMTGRAVAVLGHRAYRKGRVIAVTGIQNRLVVFLAWLAPRGLVRRMARKFNGV